ncbi:MAG TPA: Calx-beta domain-containing protein [Abditibacterium sp.]|jgi:chitinase
MKSVLLAGLLTAPLLLSAPRAQAQSSPPFALVSDAYNIETEGPGVVFFPVVLTRSSSTPVSIQWTTRDGNAKAGSDYLASSGTVVFAPGQKLVFVAVPIVGDFIEEPDEFFSLILSGAQGAYILDNVGNVGISDNDYSGTISIDDVALPEGNSGLKRFTFRVSLSKPPLHTLLLPFTTIGGSAVAGEDFVNTLGVVPFLPGQRNKTVDVAVVGDRVAEGNETFALQLLTPGYGVNKSTGFGLILNDDAGSSSQSRVAPSAPSAGAS